MQSLSQHLARTRRVCVCVYLQQYYIRTRIVSTRWRTDKDCAVSVRYTYGTTIRRLRWLIWLIIYAREQKQKRYCYYVIMPIINRVGCILCHVVVISTVSAKNTSLSRRLSTVLTRVLRFAIPFSKKRQFWFSIQPRAHPRDFALKLPIINYGRSTITGHGSSPANKTLSFVSLRGLMAFNNEIFVFGRHVQLCE